MRPQLSLVVGVLLLPACVTWRQIPMPQPPAPPSVHTNVTRVQLTTGQSAEFLTLVVATDSLFGVRNNLGRTRMTISFDQVARIEERKKDAFRTLSLIGAISVAAFYSGITGLKPR